MGVMVYSLSWGDAGFTSSTLRPNLNPDPLRAKKKSLNPPVPAPQPLIGGPGDLVSRL